MPTVKFSKTIVDAIDPPPLQANGLSSQTLYRDSALKGFGLRVGSGGTKTYFVERRIRNRVKRVTLGRHGHITAEQARKEAQRVLGEIAKGNDPLAERKANAARSVTLQTAYRDYLSARRALKPNTLHDYQRCVEGALGDWLQKPLSDITKDMVDKRHRELGERSPARANNTMRVLRALFNFALEKYEDVDGQSVLTTNPVNRLSKNRSWYAVDRRRTLLKPHELKPWYAATLQLNQETTRDYLHFLLFTGLRRTEAANLQWQDVDFEGLSFLIPDTKNNEPHQLPLPDVLLALLQRRYEYRNSPWVFPSPITDGPIKEPRTALDRLERITGKRINPHDLRRTFITTAEGLDIPAYALKRLLNHKQTNDVTAGYIVPTVDRLRKPMQDVADYFKTQMEMKQ